MLFRAVTPKAEEFLVPGAFEISCLIVFYLMMTGRLSNVTNIIRENFYNISDIPTFLFDNRMRYRDVNASARRWFPEIVGELTDDPQEYPFYTKMMRWSKDPDQDYVVQWKESYCRCQLHPVCSENVVRGYILTLLDITQQKKETVLMEDLKKKYTVVVVTHNMQQAVRVSDDTAFFLVGEMVEFGDTKTIFSYPKDKRTEDYITGRFG